MSLVSVSFYWITVAFWMSLGAGALALFLGRTKGRWGRLWFPYVAAIAIMVSEIISALLFSVGTYGPGGIIAPAFSVGMIGYLLGVPEWGRYFAAFGGVYGLGFLISASALALWQIYERIDEGVRPRAVASALVLGVWGLWGIGAYLNAPASAGLIEPVVSINTTFVANPTNDPVADAWRTEQLLAAVTAAEAVNPSAIILPEDAGFFSRYSPGSIDAGVAEHRFFSTSTAVIVDTIRVDTPDGPRLRAHWYDPVADTLATTDKYYLVPQGEFMPYFYGAFATLMIGRDKVADIADQLLTRPHTRSEGDSLPIMFCFENMDPAAAARLVAAGPVPFIAHPISHSWFNDHRVLQGQVDVMLAIAARTAGVPIVSAGNMATGKLYLPSGDIVTGNKITSGEAWEVIGFNPAVTD